jgi:hypothetical protein
LSDALPLASTPISAMVCPWVNTAPSVRVRISNSRQRFARLDAIKACVNLDRYFGGDSGRFGNAGWRVVRRDGRATRQGGHRCAKQQKLATGKPA